MPSHRIWSNVGGLLRAIARLVTTGVTQELGRNPAFRRDFPDRERGGTRSRWRHEVSCASLASFGVSSQRRAPLSIADRALPAGLCADHFGRASRSRGSVDGPALGRGGACAAAE